MKYLGLHLNLLAPRMKEVAQYLCRLLPNLGGPSEKVRRLYVGIVRLVALYGLPIWAGGLVACRRAAVSIRRAHRRLAIWVVRSYRTVSYEAWSSSSGRRSR